MTFSFDILERNLAALRLRQPEVAALIESSDLPDGLTPALGRDGTPTFLLPGEDGPMWLGGSSMPRASAEEMFGQVDPRGGSVTLPAMLTGMEAIVLAERLAPPFAVFVVDHPPSFRAALCLRQYGAYFDAGRIVLLISDDLPLRAREFFSRNPGFAMPGHMFKVPQLTAGQLANRARSLEDAGAQAMAAQNEVLTAVVRRLQSTKPSASSAATRIAILASDSGDSTIDLAQRLERALNPACEMCLPITPAQCHVAARVAAVERMQADLIVYINGIGSEERSLLPSQLPVVNWFSPGTVPRQCSSVGPFDLAVTESQSDQGRIASTGWPCERVLVLEPAADVMETDTADPARSVDGESKIVVMMDLPDDRPESVGVNLPSHLALWKALQLEVIRCCDRVDALRDIGSVLAAAQKSSGTMLTDATLAASFEGWLRFLIIPATVARSVGLGLVKSGYQPEIRGRNWPEIGRGKDLRKGVIPSSFHGQPFLESPAWIVIPWFSHEGVRIALNAMARGSIALMRGPRKLFAREYPGLAELADFIFWFGSPAQLVATLRGLISHHDSAGEKARLVARRIRADHTVAIRLQKLIRQMRASRTNPSTGNN